MFRSFVVGLVGGLAFLCVHPVNAQNAAVGQKYGQGVHDYFSGDYLGAHEKLTAAVQGGSKDPRVYYFRGLTYLKLGRSPEAANDFRQGASLEASDTNKFYNASKSLERVQGDARSELESYRANARLVLMEKAERLRKARYESIQREEARVLRAPAASPAEPLSETEAAADATETPVEPESEAAAPVAAPPAEPAKTGAKHSVLGAMGKAVGKAITGENKGAPDASKPAASDNPFGN